MTTTVILSDAQMNTVRHAAASLRWLQRDRFMLDLASTLARCHDPPTDSDLQICIRQLLGFNN